MAGSYNHITTSQGNFVSNETFANQIENLGDAYEMTEEMYGMIWWLVEKAIPPYIAETLQGMGMYNQYVQYLVSEAEQNYKLGLQFSKQVNSR